MVYRRIIIDGQELILAVGQSGKGPPCEDTPGCCGVTYLDTDSDTMYKCIGEENGCCIWEPVANDAEILRLIGSVQKDVDDLKKAISEIRPEKLTQAEYDALVAAGEMNPNTYYVILPEG